MTKKLNDSSVDESNGVSSLWCSTCGDTSVLNSNIEWFLKDEERGIGICCECAEVLEPKYLVLPDKSEDGYAKFD